MFHQAHKLKKCRFPSSKAASSVFSISEINKRYQRRHRSAFSNHRDKKGSTNLKMSSPPAINPVHRSRGNTETTYERVCVCVLGRGIIQPIRVPVAQFTFDRGPLWKWKFKAAFHCAPTKRFVVFLYRTIQHTVDPISISEKRCLEYFWGCQYWTLHKQQYY